MTITIAKWGNSVGMRIPSLTLKKTGFRIGDHVEAEVQADRSLVIRAIPKSRVDIFAMIDAITPESLPDARELDAVPSGREVW
jgi:antitoxin MazE